MILGTLALAGGMLYAISLHPPTGAHATTMAVGANCTSYASTFTVVASESGYNGSINHGAPSKPWPILCAHEGEQIKITVVNDDTVEPHGFAISNYLEAGVTVLPGHTSTITLVADSPGEFKIYCNVICAVHPYMQSGVLVVSS
jgi:nitrous oxide reductase